MSFHSSGLCSLACTTTTVDKMMMIVIIATLSQPRGIRCDKIDKMSLEKCSNDMHDEGSAGPAGFTPHLALLPWVCL